MADITRRDNLNRQLWLTRARSRTLGDYSDKRSCVGVRPNHRLPGERAIWIPPVTTQIRSSCRVTAILDGRPRPLAPCQLA
jgi:hypothetical protein